MLTLEHVKIVSPIHSKKTHTFRVEDKDGQILTIRLGNALYLANDPDREALIEYISRIQNRPVDLVVDRVPWKIGALSGISLCLREIKER